jgi:hypothetical protein
MKLSLPLARYALYTMRCRATLELAEITEKISHVSLSRIVLSTIRLKNSTPP